MKKSTDVVFDWMCRNLPPERRTLEEYVALNWCGDKTVADLEAEELGGLPEELRPFLGGNPDVMRRVN